MKKRRIHKKLKLRKDTLRTLGQDAMAKVAGGITVLCGGTNDEFCHATTLAPGCVQTADCGCNPTNFSCDGITCDGGMSCDLTLCTCP